VKTVKGGGTTQTLKLDSSLTSESNDFSIFDVEEFKASISVPQVRNNREDSLSSGLEFSSIRRLRSRKSPNTMTSTKLSFEPTSSTFDEFKNASVSNSLDSSSSQTQSSASSPVSSEFISISKSLGFSNPSDVKNYQENVSNDQKSKVQTESDKASKPSTQTESPNQIPTGKSKYLSRTRCKTVKN
jgi:hypothetical protein